MAFRGSWKVIELENALKASKKANGTMKEQLITLEHKVESLQKAVFHQQNEEAPSENSEANESQKAKCFQFTKCDFTLESKFHLKKHVKEEHLQKISCDSCHIKFDLNIDLEIHIKTHKKPKSFNCDIFSQDFLSKMAVKKAQRRPC